MNRRREGTHNRSPLTVIERREAVDARWQRHIDLAYAGLRCVTREEFAEWASTGHMSQLAFCADGDPAFCAAAAARGLCARNDPPSYRAVNRRMAVESQV